MNEHLQVPLLSGFYDKRHMSRFLFIALTSYREFVSFTAWLFRLFRSNFKLIENCTKKIIFSNPYLLHYVVKMPVELIVISIICAGDIVRV